MAVPMNDSAPQVLQVPLDTVHPNPGQPRRHFDERSIQGLAQSIENQGILQPLLVRPRPEGGYELVAGERRWRALKLLEAPTAPVIVREVDDWNLLEVALLENIQREDLSAIEEAQAYQQLLQLYECTQHELARKLGKDRTTITNTLRLLQLPESIQRDVETGLLTSGHARALLGLSSKAAQQQMREQVLRQGWSVRQTEKAVRAEQARWADLFHETGASPRPPAREAQDHHLRLLEDELSRQLRTPVTLHFQNGKGRIELHYSSLEEFERLQELLLSR